MALPISIDRLLDGHPVEGQRIEFKEGWNPAPIYRSICAFANDIANEGGRYIVVGVEKDNGLPIRRVKGIPLEQIEPLGKEMITFNNLIRPIYHSKTSVEEIDGKTVFVMWCPVGQDRPYEVPDDSYSWFMATIPFHPVFLNDSVNDAENDAVVFAELPKRQRDVLVSIRDNNRITESQMRQKFSVSRSTISRATTALKERGRIIRIGSDRNGSWMIARKVRGL